MRKVKIRAVAKLDNEGGFDTEAVFHSWGTDYEVFDNSTPNYTAAIVELPDGTIKMVNPVNIKFIFPTK